jgi:hypothetical protein
MKNKTTCDKSLTFQECELAILRTAIDLAENKMGKRLVNTPEVQDMIQIVEDFIKKKNLICYGGVAIDALLPEQDKIYNKDIELSDYDFFTPNALEDAKELADLYVERGYTEVEAKAGSHQGTFKVFCNFLGVADLTYIPKELFNAIKKDSIRIKGILYCPPNFLKMSMYLELSRPAGQIDRFEKVFKRLTLLNKYYPLTSTNCSQLDYQREMSDPSKEEEIFEIVRNTLVNQGVVFFGGYAISLYSKYMPRNLQKRIQHIADFEVLSNDPETTCEIVKERLRDIDVTNVKVIKLKPIGEIIPEHYEIKIGDDTIAFIYKPVACHSYNVINIKGQPVKVATIDTMLSFFLAFLYADRPYYNDFSDRIVCMSKFLFEVQQRNRLEQKGLLRRFSITCYGHQESVEEMRAHKAEMYKVLKDKRGTNEYDEWFLNYKPSSAENKALSVNKMRKPIKKTKEGKTKAKEGKTKAKKNKAKKTKAKTQKSFFGLIGTKTRNSK